MTTAIIISHQATVRASKMWERGAFAYEIARDLGVNTKWFEEFRRKNRDLFPLRIGGNDNRIFTVERQHHSEPRPDTMLWKTEAGAVVTLPKVSFIECPRVRA